jgi:hypothetical protein
MRPLSLDSGACRNETSPHHFACGASCSATFVVRFRRMTEHVRFRRMPERRRQIPAYAGTRLPRITSLAGQVARDFQRPGPAVMTDKKP